MSGESILFFQLENEIFVLSLWWDNECDLLFGEDLCSCGNAISKPVVFGWASITGGPVFPFAWEPSKFLLKEGFEKFSIYDQSAKRGWHTV